MTRLAVVSAGLSTPSSTRVLADSLAAAAVKRLGPDTEVEVVELRGLAHALVDHLLTGFPSPELGAALSAVAEADAVVAVTPVYSASYSALFKAFFDVLEEGALVGTPVLVAATAGTERHSLVLDHALRPLFGHLQAHVVPTGVFAASSDFGAHAPELAARVERATEELATMVEHLPRKRSGGWNADFVPFDQLLGG